MSNYARIVDGVAVDVSADPEQCFHPIIAAEFVKVPDDVTHGSQLVDGVWTIAPEPEPAPMPPAIPPKVGPIAFQLLFTSDERIEADALKATDPYIKDFWKLLDDPRTDIVDMSLVSIQASIRRTLEAVKAAGVAVDVDVRFAQILTGIPQ